MEFGLMDKVSGIHRSISGAPPSRVGLLNSLALQGSTTAKVPSALTLPMSPLLQGHGKTQTAIPADGGTTFSSNNGNYNNPSSTNKDTFVLLLTLSVICITLYFSYHLWKKHRRIRRAGSVSKLEDYSYSRLSQNEIDVDNIQFNNTVLDQENCTYRAEETEENQDKNNPAPATLHVETDTTLGKHQSYPSAVIDELSDEDLLQ